ncbi:MAG: hypothetical protein QOE37_1545 [Microbacteriaceae bacterium]|nr:hypothetical protein [Microbacteriaceae bacterium]
MMGGCSAWWRQAVRTRRRDWLRSLCSRRRGFASSAGSIHRSDLATRWKADHSVAETQAAIFALELKPSLLRMLRT